MSSEMNPQYKVVRGFNDDVFVELWDKTLAAAGLAFLLRRSPQGLTLRGFDVDVPVEVFQQFFLEALAYVCEDPQALLGMWVKRSADD